MQISPPKMDMLGYIAAAYREYGTPGLTNFQIEDLTENAGYEAGVFTLADVQGRVVLIRRKPVAGYPGIERYWWIPGGECEAGEGLDEAAVREFREETGLEVRLDRLLVALVKEKRFFLFWFRGHVVGGSISALGDPCNTTAGVKAFSPSDIPVGALWSEVDKVVLAQEGFIEFPIHGLVTKYRA